MSKGSLLLVDDDRHVLESMADWLREQDYDLDEANSFAAAQAALARNTYDVVLADIALRDGDGFDLIGVCQQKNAQQKGKQTSVILMTGYGTVDNAVEAIRAGAFDFDYLEVDGNHGSMVPMVWPAIFEFFAGVSARAAEKKE